MILGREEIRELVNVFGLIEKFDKECLESSGYDLRVKEVYKIKGEAFLGKKERKSPKIERLDSEECLLKPGDYVLVESLEEVSMPESLMARILPRSTLFRYGCALLTAVVDPGFEGNLTMGLKNLSSLDFKFEKRARIAQIVFEKVEGKTKNYEGKYQGGEII